MCSFFGLVWFEPLAHLGWNPNFSWSCRTVLLEKGGPPVRPGGKAPACGRAEGLRGLPAGNLWGTDRWLCGHSVLRETHSELGVSDLKTPWFSVQSVKALGPLKAVLWSRVCPTHPFLSAPSPPKRAVDLTLLSSCATSCFQINELIWWKLTEGNSLILESTKNLSVVTRLILGGSRNRGGITRGPLSHQGAAN